MKIVKVRFVNDLIKYQELTERWLGICFPMEYLATASVYVAKNYAGEFVGGFCVQTKGSLRVLDSIPRITHKDITQQKLRSPVELTGLWFQPWVRNPKGRVRFWLGLCRRFIRHSGKDVVFAYTESKNGLAKAYAAAKPRVLFVGVTNLLPGMAELESEVVCVVPGYRIALLPLLSPGFYLKRLFSRRAALYVP